MRNLVNIGKDKEDAYVDPDDVFLIVNDDSRGFGTIVGIPSGPVRSSYTPEEVYEILKSGKRPSPLKVV